MSPIFSAYRRADRKCAPTVREAVASLLGWAALMLLSLVALGSSDARAEDDRVFAAALNLAGGVIALTTIECAEQDDAGVAVATDEQNIVGLVGCWAFDRDTNEVVIRWDGGAVDRHPATRFETAADLLEV